MHVLLTKTRLPKTGNEMQTVKTRDLRLFIIKHFSDDDLETFCFDYFPDVGNNFTTGMKKNDKVMQLITYCRNRQLMPTLLRNVQQERPRPYRTTFSKEENRIPPIKPKFDQCTAITKRGNRCRNKALNHTDYCGLHTKKPKAKLPQTPPPPVEVPRQSQGMKMTPDKSSFVHERTGMEFVRIPAGEFTYSRGRTNLFEFWMSKTAVTNAAYKRFVPTWRYESGKEGHPAVRISWHDAVTFCERAGLALPTEAQWEMAARGTDGREYPWGNDEPTDKLCNFDGNVDGTTAVYNYSPQGDSPYGCVDMSGNVWEWCLNKYKTPEVTAIDKTNDLRIVRGGSWRDSSRDVRTTHRFNFSPNARYFNLGFRVVVGSDLRFK